MHGISSPSHLRPDSFPRPIPAWESCTWACSVELRSKTCVRHGWLTDEQAELSWQAAAASLDGLIARRAAVQSVQSCDCGCVEGNYPCDYGSASEGCGA